MKVLTDWINFFLFLKEPDYSTSQQGILSKTFLTFNSLVLFIILSVPVFIGYSVYTLLLDEVPKSLHQNVIELYPPLILYVMVAVYEEISFRGFLRKFNPLVFSISIAGIVGIYFKKIAFRNMMFELEGLRETGILILIVFAISFLVAKMNSKQLNYLWEKQFIYLFYANAFLFAFMHFFNSVDLNLYYLPSIIFQFIMALIFSYVRIRSGLIYAIVIHFIWNILIYGI